MERPRRRAVVAILGGGFSGAAVALHLARSLSPAAAEIAVIEPREALGHGLAYGTDDPEHRINVPAAKMTAFADDPGHFERWLAERRILVSDDARTMHGDLFPQRRVFGRYMEAQLAPFLASGAIRHLRCAAEAVSPLGRGHRIELSDGSEFVADLVVLAMTHPKPALPRALRTLAGSPRLIADPYGSAAIAEIRPDERVLVVGCGLTSADVIASLAARGHRGRVTALSRHGLRSRGQDMPRQTSAADFVTSPEERATALLRRVRAAVAADARDGGSWHGTIDAVRRQGQEIWSALAPAERARLARHLRRFWDVHRFRLAPQVEAALDRRLAARRLDFVAARLVAAREAPEGIVVDYRRRREADLTYECFDRVVVTTGPDHSDALQSNPALRSLAAAGLLRPDPNCLGLLVAEGRRAVDAQGRASEVLFVAGPLARGGVGELMGAMEVARHAEDLARVLRCRLGDGAAAPVGGSAAA